MHPVLFDRLIGSLIRLSALKATGTTGPSGIDAAGWHQLCTAFHASSRALCNTVAVTARRLCSSFVDQSPLQAYIACRLIPLDKNLGIRPIGVCDTVRRIIGKAVMSIVSSDIQEVTGSLQVCAGQDAGCEATVHAM